MRSPSPNGANGRDGRGRFAPGNPGGPGNPFARSVAALRSALLGHVDDEVVSRLVKALVEQAEAGNVAAAKLLLEYTLGKPLDSVDPDRLDAHEVATLRAGPTIYDEMPPAPLSTIERVRQAHQVRES